MSSSIRLIAAERTLLSELLAQSQAEGFDHVRRLIDCWSDASNRFDRPGERLFGAFVNDSIAGVGGLNRDPYTTTPRMGRIRHVYMSPDVRRLGVGSALIKTIVGGAHGEFDVVRLRAAKGDASTFYDALGFEQVAGDEFATHYLRLRG